MFGKRIRLFTLLGFEVNIDLSWILIAVLVTWSLAVGFFPFYYEGLTPGTYWLMGMVGALGLFLSVIVHEFSHSLVARKFGMPMKGITLFLFGGVAEMEDEPPSAKAEFWMAIVGPLTSIALALGFYGIYLSGVETVSVPINAVIGYLALINGILAAFNLVPAFPLDGGRVLRSILWGTKKNLRWATRVSSEIGAGFGILLMFMGVVQIFAGNLIGGMWWVLIGLFLQNAAKMGYQQVLTRNILGGEKVRRFMKTDAVAVPPTITIAELVEDYVYRYHYKFFPVTEGKRLVGCISTREIKEVPREQWESKRVVDVVSSCSPDNTITSEADAMQALSTMSRTGVSRLMVIEGERLEGIIALKDLMQLLSLKMELEEADEE
jgi:Zn-dependent protease/CBS domain-containing protein